MVEIVMVCGSVGGVGGGGACEFGSVAVCLFLDFASFRPLTASASKTAIIK